MKASLLITAGLIALLTGVYSGSANAADVAASADPGQGDDAVLLEEHLDLDITSVTAARVHYLSRIEIKTQRGADRYDSDVVGYSPGMSIRSLRGAVVSPAGKRVEVKKQQISDGAAFASFELYADRMLRAIVFPGVIPGSIVEFEYELMVQNLHYLPDEFSLQDAIPAREKVLTVRYPTSFPMRLQAHGAAPEHSVVEKDGFVTHRWTVRDVPALRVESMMPPLSDVQPHVSISPKAIQWSAHALDAANWQGVAAFYWTLAKDRMEPGPEVSRMARELTAHTTDEEGKVRALFEFAQGRINYVSIALGIGGWQPHASADVLRHRYGDCKDKATLMVAMLKAIGLVGYPVLIMTRSEGLIDRDDPGLNFNHAIVAVPRGEGYLFLDPTDDVTPYGDLPWVDQGVPVLVVKGEGAADFIETPLSPPERNRMHREVTAAIAPNGSLEGTYRIEAWGQQRVEMDSLLDAGAATRDDRLEDLVAWLCPGAVMRSHEITAPAGPLDPIRVAIRFHVPQFVTRAGNAQILSPHLARVQALSGMASYSTRRHPVFFQFLTSETSEVRLQLPAGMSLKRVPADGDLKGPGLTSVTRYALTRDAENRHVLILKREATLARREIPVSDYAQLRTFLASLAEEEARAVTLVPAS